MEPINTTERTQTEQTLLELTQNKPKDGFLSHFIEILVSTIPTAVYLFAQLVMPLINLKFIAANCTDVEVDGVGLGNTWLVATHLSLVLGLNTGTSTLGAQAFGASNFHVFSLYFHRGLIMRVLMFIPSYALCFLSYYFFKLIGVEDEIAWAARNYCVCSALALISITLYDTLKSFIMAHNIFLPPMIIQIIVCISHWFWCILFVEKLKMGILGVGLAFGTSQISGAIALFIFILLYKEFKETRIAPTRECLRGWWGQLKDEFYIASFMILEWMAYECCTLITGHFDKVQIAAQAFVYSIVTALFTPTIALTVVGSIYVGTALGLKDPVKARMTTKVLFMMALIIIVLQGSLFYFLREKLTSFLTPDVDVQTVTISALMMYLIFMPIDVIQMTTTAILKGAGKEKITALFYLIAFYLIGLTCAYIFGAVVLLYTKGIWLGIGIGIISMEVMAGFVLWRLNFKEQIKSIETRMLKDETPKLIDETEGPDSGSI